MFPTRKELEGSPGIFWTTSPQGTLIAVPAHVPQERTQNLKRENTPTDEIGIDGVSVFKQVGFVLSGLKDENPTEFEKALDDINKCLTPYGFQLVEQAK